MVSVDAIAASDVITREFRGSAGDLHAVPMPVDVAAAELWIMRPTSTALVMGSSQRPDQFDHAALLTDGVELAARRSGGGAVFIDPAVTVWIDLVAPRSSRWWHNELAQNFILVGEAWQKALGALGLGTDLCIVSGERSAASGLACWAGLGWGELTIDGAKVVGLSQRRTRWGCRVQTMAVLDSSSTRVVDYFASRTDRSIVDAALAASSGLSGLGVTPGEVEASVLAAFAD